MNEKRYSANRVVEEPPDDPTEAVKWVWSRILGYVLNPRNATAITAVMTTILAITTVIYTIYSSRQWRATKDSVDSANASQRAFVYFDPVTRSEASVNIKTNQIDSWVFSVPMLNSGETQTKNMLDHISGDIYDELPDHFSFPDLGDLRPIPVVLGPKQKLYTGTVRKGIEEMRSVWGNGGSKRKHLYVWGWATYNDILTAKPHLTQFCYEISFTGPPDSLPFVSSGRTGTWASLCDRHNCTDEECSARK